MDKLQRDITETYARSYLDEKERADDLANKSYAYYKKDIFGIRAYLKSYLSSIINPLTVKKMPLVTINFVPKILKRLTLLYKEEPTIEVSNVDYYNEINWNLNSYRKEFHRLGKLFNTILIRPIWDEDRFRYLILHRGICDVITKEDDPFAMEEVIYPVIKRINDKEQTINLHWTDDDFWATDENGRVINIEIDGKPLENIYKRIPFVLVRMETAADFWGDGLGELVMSNEILNARLSDMIFKQYLSFGIPIGTNLNMKLDEFALSPDLGVFRDNVKVDDITPDLKFATPDHKLELDKTIIDWYKGAIANSLGLSPSSFSDQEIANSGYAKMIDSLELIDLNKDDEAVMRQMEYELFELQNLVLEKEGKKGFGDGFEISYKPITFPQSPDEIWREREKRLEYNMETPVDWIMEDKGLDEDSAEDKLKKNKEINRKYKGQSTSIIDELNLDTE